MGFEQTPEARKQLVDGLRKIARFFETHEDFPLPAWQQNLSVFGGYTGLEPREEAALAVRALGSCKKDYEDTLAEITKEFGPFLRLRYLQYREKICTRVVVGTTTVPAFTVPAKDAYEVPESTVEKIEWKCEPILAVKEQ